MEIETEEARELMDLEDGDDAIERGATGVKILLTLLFFLIARVVETVLVVAVCFGLGFALITRRPPSESVRRFTNRVLSYYWAIFRYLSYNESRPPFPFSELPPEIEPTPSERAILDGSA
jgi:hypothetical protein